MFRVTGISQQAQFYLFLIVFSELAEEVLS
jgi:hypothetical protein